MTTTFLDLRAEQKPTRPRFRMSRGHVVSRAPHDVVSVTLHQTACVFGPLGDPKKRHRRALNVACHALSFNDGAVALPAPLLWYVNGANGLNPITLNLEIEGHFAGRPDDPATPKREDTASTWGGGATLLTELGLQTAKDALRWLVNEGRTLGMPLRYLHAHRQASASRRSDPGWALWRALAPFAESELGLVAQPDLIVGDGRAIPREWDDAAKASY